MVGTNKSNRLTVIKDDRVKMLTVRKGEELFRYLYTVGQWQKLMGVSWMDIEHEELI